MLDIDPIIIFSDFINPKKRIFLGYLFSGFLIALLWLIFVKKTSIINSLKFVFDKKIYTAKSSFVDYFMYIFNMLIMILFSPVLLSQLFIATLLFDLLYEQNLIEPYSSNYIGTLLPILFTLSFFIIDDFSKFILHMMMHKIKFLWIFHKVHHSAEVLTPMTVFRTHPFEGILFVIRNAISQGSVIGVFFYISAGELSLITVLGANIFSFIFHLLGSNLRHSHISISYWNIVEKILISPAQHQIHHSVKKEHYDKNFGVTFAVWDLIFGSLLISKSDQQIKYGLSQKENYFKHNLFSIYINPIMEAFRILQSSCQRIFSEMFKIIILKFINLQRIFNHDKN